MLFHVTWRFIDMDEASLRRNLRVFEAWQPPPGAEFKAFTVSPTGAVASP